MPAARSRMRFRMAKITSFFSRSPIATANASRKRGHESFQKLCLRRLARSFRNPQSEIRNCAVATFISNSPEETEKFGREFAGKIDKGAVVALEGELGAGKTQFVKGLVAGLDCASEVTS